MAEQRIAIEEVTRIGIVDSRWSLTGSRQTGEAKRWRKTQSLSRETTSCSSGVLKIRPLDLAKHKQLEASMQKHGFLMQFPIVCIRGRNGQLFVHDGQHRLHYAEMLGLPVHYIVVDDLVSVAELAQTVKSWTTEDFAKMYAAKGLPAYIEGVEFAEKHAFPFGIAFAALAGTTTFSNIKGFRDGLFEVTEREWARDVGRIYGHLTGLSRSVRSVRLIEALMAVCRVPEFDAERLLQGAERCRDKLVSYSTRDAYLSMLEEVYNFGRKTLVGLKVDATMAMRDRNFKHKGK